MVMSVLGTGAAITWAAAAPSRWKLSSPTQENGLKPREPPITTSSRRFPAKVGSSDIAVATLVRGARVSSEISPGEARTVSMRKSTAGLPEPRSALLAAPATRGTSTPTRCSRSAATPTPTSVATLPKLIVIPSRRAVGEASTMSTARASSTSRLRTPIAGSQSISTRCAGAAGRSGVPAADVEGRMPSQNCTVGGWVCPSGAL